MKTEKNITTKYLSPLRWLVIVTLLALLVPSFPSEPASAQTGHWSAEFYPNTTLSGPAIFTRNDNQISFDWGTSAPAAGVPADNFSARWTRTEWFESGTYRFHSRSDDGFQLWVGNIQVFNNWLDQQGGWQTRDLYISQGTYQVKAEYYENTGGALVTMSWEWLSGGPGWQAEYYTNKDLTGSPSPGSPALGRSDAYIDFNWGAGSPHHSIPVDGFSARWSQTLGFAAGNYRFSASADDGVRIWVDNQLVVDAWDNQQMPNTRIGDRVLTEGLHDLRVEYFENDGLAEVHIGWQRLDSNLTDWKGEYFNNRDLVGSPVLTRDDAAIHFDWGEGSPVPWMPYDNFSVRWTRQLVFSPGYYRFSVQSDDGARVWLNNGLVIDKWMPVSDELDYVDGIYLSGANQLKVEYFEQGGHARIQFLISPSGSASPPTTPSNWLGEYFNNANLVGTPTLIRNDGTINFDWAWSSPAQGINSNQFSVRWTQTLANLPVGTYRFVMTVDDGGRLWVKDQLVIDTWGVQSAQAYTVDVVHTGGSMPIKMEYFESGGVAVAKLTWSLNTGITPPPTTPTTVLVEENSPGFVKGGAAAGWRTAWHGSGGRTLWTYNNDYSRPAYNWAGWYPDLDPGRYEVFVFIPAGNATTTNARYWVQHNDGYSFRRVNQMANQGVWVSLGTFNFAGDDSEYVSLSDVTYEHYLAKMIAFDAVKWEPR